MRSAEALSCSSAFPSARSCLLHPENVLELPPTPDFKQKSQVQSLFPRWKSFWRQGGWSLAPTSSPATDRKGVRPAPRAVPGGQRSRGQSRAYPEAAGGASGPFWRERGSGQCTPAPGHKWNTKWGIYGEREMRKKSLLFYNLVFFFFLLSYLILQNSSPAVDFRTMNQAHYTSLINDETIAVWRQKLSEHDNANTIKYVVACFQFFLKCIGISNLVIFPYFHLEVVTINGVCIWGVIFWAHIWCP